MAERISLSELARRLGRAKSGLHKLAATGQIPKGDDGKFDEADVRAALAANTDPARQPGAFTGVHGTENGERPAALVAAAAQAGVEAHLARTRIREILAAEGVVIADGEELSFNQARTAEKIVQTWERDRAHAEAAGRMPTLLAACLEVLIKPATWLLLGAAILGGYVYGGHVEKAACGRAMQASVDAARSVDRQAAEAAHAAMQDQIAARDARAIEADRQIKEYEDALAKQPDRRCDLDDDDLRALGRMQQHRVPGRPKGPAPGGGRDPGRGGVRPPD